jgi:hypothetical protein
MPFKFLILGAECYLQLTIKNFHGNTSTKFEALADDAPVIVFGKGCWFALGEMEKPSFCIRSRLDLLA